MGSYEDALDTISQVKDFLTLAETTKLRVAFQPHRALISERTIKYNKNMKTARARIAIAICILKLGQDPSQFIFESNIETESLRMSEFPHAFEFDFPEDI